jgi:glc operon protein GlcG
MPAVIRSRRVLDPAGAEAVTAAAVRAADEGGHRVVVAVVDAAGDLLQLRRTDGAQTASVEVGIDKARTAAIFVRPSRELEEQVSSGRLGALALHGAAALTGGIPLTVDGEVVGAVGTSGETPDEDESVSLAGAAADFSTVEVPALTYEGARLAAEAVRQAATAAQVASVAVATDKARTAAIYRRPSKDFEDQASNGRPSALHLARAVPLQGGVPILHEGHVVGAVGVSGASSADEDQELAMAGAAAAHAAAAAPAPRATLFPAEAVRERFTTGGLLESARGYALDAGRRTGPGEVELHERATDVMHVVAGTATVVTGGEGGVAHRIGPGDVLVIPAGVPHEFVEAADPFLYLVVKVES